MNGLVVLLQILLLLPALPVAVMSWRTSRRRRSRHHALAALAGLLSSIAVALGGVSFGLAMDSDDPVDLWLSFGPPVLTLLLCGWVLLRSRANRKRPG